MNSVRNSLQRPNSQRGAVLLVSLIILLVLTLLGIATMESTGMEMKMANRSREHMIAMQAAEAGLRAAEMYIQDIGFSENELTDSGCNAGTQNCFKEDCSDGGYCFNGTNAGNWSSCSLTAPAQPVWNDSALAVWTTNGRHHQLVSGQIKANVKYVVEFLCYIPGTVGEIITVNPHFLFRITSLAVSDSGKSQVMLQSTYKLKAS